MVAVASDAVVGLWIHRFRGRAPHRRRSARPAARFPTRAGQRVPAGIRSLRADRLGYVTTSYAPGDTGKAALVTTATNLAGTVGAIGIVVTATLSIFGSVTVNSLLVSRRLLGLAQMPALLPWFGSIREETSLPRNAVLFTIAVTTALALGGGFTALAILSVTARMLIYLSCIAALPIVRAKRGLPRSHIENGMVVVAMTIPVVLIFQSDWKTWGSLAIAISAGFAIRLVASLGIPRQSPLTRKSY